MVMINENKVIKKVEERERKRNNVSAQNKRMY